MTSPSSDFDNLQHPLGSPAFSGTIATTMTNKARRLRLFFAPWSTCGCPKSWGQYSPEHTEPGLYVSLGFEDDLGSVNVEGEDMRDAQRKAEREGLSHLRKMDAGPLSLKQRATRARALTMLAAIVEDVDFYEGFET